LKYIEKTGETPKDALYNKPIHGHHHKQEFHRKEGAFVVEMPGDMHKIGNKNQHPLGNKGGLSETERVDWYKLRKQYWKERAKTELLRRGQGE
jgi:hypothetical protein